MSSREETKKSVPIHIRITGEMYKQLKEKKINISATAREAFQREIERFSGGKKSWPLKQSQRQLK